MSNVTFIIASRNRPVQLCETLEISLKNISESSTRTIVALDKDDEFTCEYVKRFFGNAIELSIEDREDGFGDKWNRVIRLAPATLYACGFDGEGIATKGWDSLFLEAYENRFPEDGIGAIYNPLVNASFPSSPAYSAKLVEKLGYIYPPYFPFWFIDHWMDEILQLIQRIGFADVRTTEINGRGKTMAMRDLRFWGTFFDETRAFRCLLAKQIIDGEDFLETPRRKAMLLSNFELFLPKLTIMNAYVRRNWKEIEKVGSEDAPRDPRTLRAIHRAESFLISIGKTPIHLSWKRAA